MRLAYIDPHPVPDGSPESLQILQTVDALAAIGVEVTLVTPRPPGGTTIEQVLGRPAHPGLRCVYEPVWRQKLPILKRSARLFNYWARRWLSRHGADVVFVRNLKLADALLQAGIAPPLIFEAHEIFAHTYRDEHPELTARDQAKLQELASREARVYGGVSGVAALTGLLLEDLREAYGYAGPGVVVPDGVDLDLARQAQVQVAPGGALPVLLYLGSLHVWKGVETAIAAMARIPGAVLRIAGGPDSRVRELEAQARALGVQDRVEFLGHVNPLRRFEVIAAADVCLLPLGNYRIGQRHTSPLKLFEYLAMGKPVVAADMPALREVITHQETALLFPSGDVPALAEQINQLLADAALRARLGAAAQSLAQSYGWQARAGCIRKLCEELRHA